MCVLKWAPSGTDEAPPHVFVVKHTVEIEVENVFSRALGHPVAEHIARRRPGAPEPCAQGGLGFLRGKSERCIAHEDIELAFGHNGRVRNHDEMMVHPLFVDSKGCLESVLGRKSVGASDEARRQFAELVAVAWGEAEVSRAVKDDAHVVPGATHFLSDCTWRLFRLRAS